MSNFKTKRYKLTKLATKAKSNFITSSVHIENLLLQNWIFDDFV